MEYRIQLIYFNGKKTHRILQNVGGPCPLLGLCNVLLLNNDIRVNQTISSIKFSDLTYCLKDHLHKLFEVNMGSKTGINESEMANAIQNIEDCIKLFPKLEEGLDINIKFSDVDHFEFTPAVAMFDSYNIRLLHGWVVDPQNTALYNLVKDRSYNEVVDFLTSDQGADANDDEIAQNEQDKAVLREFLANSAQQLTAHGLFRMHEVMNDNEIAIFFRNNHFAAVYKRQGFIWELVTDEGIVDADPRITWVSLSQLSGDEVFASNKFAVISQNVNQQAQIESYNNVLKQQQENKSEDDQKQDQADDANNDNNANPDADDDGNDKHANNANEQNAQENNNESTNNNNNVNDSNSNNADNNGNDADNDKESQAKTGFNLDEQEAYLQKQYEESNPAQNVNESTGDDAVAQQIALEQQLGLESGELERLQREQKEAMAQIEQQKKAQQQAPKIQSNQAQPQAHQYPNQHHNNNDSYAYAHSYEAHNPPQQSRKARKRNRRGRSRDDDCVIL
eukprot:CAMPEP_0197034620 /NCGR_PEP_ID=MMETSP1384-20130603/12678_1 /TAXON_ID=29189 /ORGANISM="Ammonia sp." /LENGTH=506 /DNA_ID=CAMNT_0042464569 /DNA_START=24 /DNA_END=1544 /DNA_ORIENTATION=+